MSEFFNKTLLGEDELVQFNLNPLLIVQIESDFIRVF